MNHNQRYGLIGEKLSHSYSKQIHEILASYTYELIPLTKEEFEPFMRQRAFAAINVTIPYKQAVLPFLDALDETSKQVGAVNTIVQQNGRLTGYNTDFSGFLYTLHQNQIRVCQKKVLVLGNGGAAKAVLAVLKQEKAGEIITVKYKKEASAITYEEAAALHTDAAIIINTSPVGMYPNIDVSPIDLTPYKNCEAAIDLIYNPEKTKFLEQAKTLSIKAVNGLEMLVAQAKYAVEYFLQTEIKDTRIPEILSDLREK